MASATSWSPWIHERRTQTQSEEDFAFFKKVGSLGQKTSVQRALGLLKYLGELTADIAAWL